MGFEFELVFVVVVLWSCLLVFLLYCTSVRIWPPKWLASDPARELTCWLDWLNWLNWLHLQPLSRSTGRFTCCLSGLCFDFEGPRQCQPGQARAAAAATDTAATSNSVA